jgi:hypothetical protein
MHEISSIKKHLHMQSATEGSDSLSLCFLTQSLSADCCCALYRNDCEGPWTDSGKWWKVMHEIWATKFYVGWTSKGGDSCHVGHDAVLLACSSWCVQGPLDSEGEHIKIFWNVRNYVPNDPVSYPHSLDSSAIPLNGCQISCQNVMWPVIVQQSYIVVIWEFLSVITVCNENWHYTRRHELSLI